MNNKGQSETSDDIIKGILGLIVAIIIFITIGKQFHWFDFMKSTGFIVTMIIIGAIILGVILGVVAYYIRNWDKIQRAKAERIKEAERIAAAEEEKKRQAEEKRNREIDLRTNLILKKILTKDKEYLTGLNKKEKEYRINLRRKEIMGFVESGNDDERIIDYYTIEGSPKPIKVRGGTETDEEEELFNAVLKKISEDYEADRTFRDEREFETSLYEFLKAHFPNHSIVPQYRTAGRGKVDIVIDDEVAIELKIADRFKNLHDLISQIHFYKKEFDKIIIGILDVGLIDEDEMNEMIEEYENMGAEVIVKEGRLSTSRMRGY